LERHAEVKPPEGVVETTVARNREAVASAYGDLVPLVAAFIGSSIGDAGY
jgi:hypothetical protein